MPRIIDLGVTKENVKAWDRYDRRRARQRLLAYLWYPKSTKHRRRFLAAISANDIGKLETQSASGVASHEVTNALMIERQLITGLGGYGLLAEAEPLTTYMSAQRPGEHVRASDVIIAALIVTVLAAIRGTPGTHRGAGVNATLPIVEDFIRRGGFNVPSNRRELRRAWARSKTVAHLCFALLAEIMAARAEGRNLERIRLDRFMRCATAAQVFLLETFPHARREPIVGEESLWRLPTVNGLKVTRLKSLPLLPLLRELIDSSKMAVCRS